MRQGDRLMNVIYAGKQQDFSQVQTKKLNARIAKVGKMVDGRGEKEMHIYFTTQRHLTKAEATLNYYGHSAAGAANETDAFNAVIGALEKLEKQIVKMRTKWRDVKRAAVPKEIALKETVAIPEARNNSRPRINRVQVSQRRKPMTVEEALLVIEKNDHYLPFRDVETGNVSVLVRRPDGQYDLIET